MKTLKVLSTLFMLCHSILISQTINQLDEQGKYHGIWKKNFDNTIIIRYEGEFFHGKEIGLFKFYKNIKGRGVLTATKLFNENNNITEVKFFGSNGKLISEGTMDGKTYIGTWKYYQKTNNGLLTLEHYDDSGNLVGERTVFYPNGQVAEIQNYKSGVLNGVSKWFTESNVLLKEFMYLNGELQGISKYYNAKGELEVEGHYKKDKKHGIWKYYENGVLVEEKDFTYVPKYIKK